ncbi:HD-GYP domain-containing protein [Vogesella mureinivorans]|uniref:HD-GYP domain-containing protein n=1 Tax=Vogesella mureinivorans TaxID=657276 RepID=UPI0011CC9882|nr:HD domain-containing phosphohydrolase [Vogesella mureinivorans]
MHKPIDYSIFDRSGNLILRKGFVVSMPGFAEKLVERGYFIGISEAGDLPSAKEIKTRTVRRPEQQTSVFIEMASFVEAIARIHRIILSPPSNLANVEELMRSRAHQLVGFIAHDPDAVLAALYLQQHGQDLRANKHVLGAAVCYMLASQICHDDMALDSLLCAALTRDLALYHFDKGLGAQKDLGELEQLAVWEHTSTAVKLLQKHGIQDKQWLLHVYEHHEQPNGRGYPLAKTRGEAHELSLLLGLADAYAGMTIANKWRPGIYPANTLKELYLQKDSKYLESHIGLLIKKLTRFPAGTVVALQSGEIGVVKNTNYTRKSPMVYSIIDEKGFPRSEPTPRDTLNAKYEIKGCISPERCKTALLAIKRIWM